MDQRLQKPFMEERYIPSLVPRLAWLGIPYSRKYWRSIKFGSLAVGEATVKFKSVKFKVRSTYIRIILRVRVCAYYMYGTTAKFKSANIFILAARDQTTKFKDRQYFRLYGI